MNQLFQNQPLAPARTLRQQGFEFARSHRWQRLPGGAQQACRQALARLLCQVISTIQDEPIRQENDDER
jgi:hypothetical protein